MKRIQIITCYKQTNHISSTYIIFLMMQTYYNHAQDYKPNVCTKSSYHLLEWNVDVIYMGNKMKRIYAPKKKKNTAHIKPK